MTIVRNLIILIIILFFSPVNSSEQSFSDWLKSFKKIALKNGISENTYNTAMSNVKFLPKVIEYDRFSQNFTKTQLHI